MRTVGLALIVAAAAIINIRLAAQGGRPPDIAGEWRLDSAEDPGQPPLADYLGLALNEVEFLRQIVERAEVEDVCGRAGPIERQHAHSVVAHGEPQRSFRRIRRGRGA